MIQQLKTTENYRSFLDTDTGDVIMQGNPDGSLIGMATGEYPFFDAARLLRGHHQRAR